MTRLRNRAMIDSLKKHFDDFVFEARIKPALVASFPIFMIAVSNGLLNREYSEAGLAGFFAIILIGFMAHSIREFGKKYEEKLFKELGGKPTSIILRFSDSTVDNISKIRYHHWLNTRIDGLKLPLSLEEENNDPQSDDKYESSINFLRNYANSHRDELPRVYQELKKYNYWRNLYGGKWLVLLSYMIAILYMICRIFTSNLGQDFTLFLLSSKELLGMLMWFIMFCSVVTKKVVKRNAYDYAKALLESIELLSRQSD